MKFSIQKPDNTTEDFEIVSGTPEEVFTNDRDKSAICKVWRELITAEDDYRVKYGIEYKNKFDNDEAIVTGMTKLGGKIYLVRDHSGDVIGIAIVKDTQFKNIYNISDVSITEEHRGKGIGKVLMQTIMEENVPAVPSLTVELDNTHAVDLYRSLGFVEYGLKMVLGQTEEQK